MFKAYSEAPYSQGFSMTFGNGWTVSVQFGKANYGGNETGANHSKTAEIAAWDQNDNWYKFDNNDTVKGWCKPDEVADFMVMIKAKES